MTNKIIPKQLVASAIFLSLLSSVLVLINLLFGFSLPLYLLVAICVVTLSFVYPLAGLLAVTFLTLLWSQNFTLSPFIFNQSEYKFYLVDLFLVPIYFRTALDWFKYRQPALTGFDKLLLVFFAWVALIFVFSLAFWDANLATAVSSLKNYIFYPLLFFVIWYQFRNRQIFSTWFAFFMAGALASLGFFVHGLLTGQGLWTDITPLSTAGSRFLDFNHAFYLCLAFILGLPYLIWRKDQFSRVLTWLLPLFVAGILGSLMRHLWLALTIYLVWLLITLGSDRASLKKLVAKYLALVIVIFSLGIFVANLMPHSQLTQSLGDQRGYLATRFFSLFDDGDTSIAWRGTLWNNAWSNFLDAPLTGAGLGQKIFIDMGSYKDYVELRNIHNSFLAVLTQLGAVGLLLLLVFVLAQLIKIWTFKVRTNLDLIVRYSVSGIIIFCTIAFMFQPYLEANFFSIWWWLFLGLGHAYYESTLS